MAIINFNAVTLKTARSNAILTAIGNYAVVNIYTGAPPADASVAPTGTQLASLACSAVFGTLIPGVSGGAAPYLIANAIASANGIATGTPGYARVQTSGGVGVVDLDCGATGSGAAVIMTPDTITAGAPVNITSLAITES